MVELEAGQTQIGTWQAIIDPLNPELNFHLEGMDDMINNHQEASFYSSSSCIYYLWDLLFWGDIEFVFEFSKGFVGAGVVTFFFS